MKRLDWCNKRMEEKEAFDDNTHPNSISGVGISKQGATQLVIVDGIMNATRYGDILKASLVPFIQKSYPESHRLYQDNDPKHTSKYIQQFFQMNRINWWKSPAESPGLNPIEKVWGSMKTYLRDKHKPRNLAELKEGIRTYWKKLTPEVCTRYIDHLQKMMPGLLRRREPLQDIEQFLRILLCSSLCL